MRLCTDAHRLQPRRALLELRRLGVDALEHQPDLGAVLAAQAAQLEHLLGELAARVADAARDVALDLLRAVAARPARSTCAALRQQLRRRAPPRAPAGGSRPAPRRRRRRAPPAPARADSGNTRCGGDAERARGRRAAAARSAPRTCSARRQRVDQRVDLVQHDEARRRVRAEVVAPDRQVGLGDAGVGAEDEDRRVRASAAG